jgi:excisionase family DNA binding protein
MSNPRVINLDDYFETPAEACVGLGISIPTLTKRVREGKIPSIKIGMFRLVERPQAEQPTAG